MATSEVTRQKINDTPDAGRREALLDLLHAILVHPLTDEARQLADRYVGAGVFPATVVDDARHVAVAILTRQDVLVSWNFKHIVSRRNRAAINQCNTDWGLPTIEVVPPPEV